MNSFSMRFVASLLMIFLSSAGVAGFEKQLPKQAEWSLTVRDLGGTLNVNNGSGQAKLMGPGSLNKLFVAGFALAGKMRLDGRLSVDASGNLYLQGGGNALLDKAGLVEVVDKLVNKGTGEVTGDIVVDDSMLDIKGLERTRRGSAYAPPGALGLDLHTVAVTVKPGWPGEAPPVEIEPPNKAVRIAVPARTVKGAANTIKITRLDDLAYKVTGNIGENGGMVSERFSLDDPALYAGGVLKSLLADKGVAVKGKIRKGKTPGEAVLLADLLPGPDKDEMLRKMNVHSLNVLADNLFLKAGTDKFGVPGTREKGVRVTGEFLKGLGLPMDEVEISDGSGLSGRNRVTADFMTKYLYQVSKKPWFERFKNTLPRPGREGTVKDIPFDDPRFRVKSGWLEDVYALAGYGIDAVGREVAFTFIMNGPGVGLMPNSDQSGAEVLESIRTGTYAVN
ncbi:MAG: D-alanyl-D-alanine carboxypeptidase/D-alanyl-D-alanine-endopeptidase [Thermodesulfobacteriota bacterium]